MKENFERLTEDIFERLTWKVVVTTGQSKIRVIEANMVLDPRLAPPTARSYSSFVDQGFRPTWRVE